MIKKHKVLVIVLSSILIFAILISSCIADTYSYYFDAMRVKQMFYKNKQTFESIVEYLLSENIEKVQTLELDTDYSNSEIYDNLVSIDNPHIIYKYYDDVGYVLNEHKIRFYYSYSSSELYLEYSSNDYGHKRSGYYEWGFEKICDNWFLNYETIFINEKG